MSYNAVFVSPACVVILENSLLVALKSIYFESHAANNVYPIVMLLAIHSH